MNPYLHYSFVFFCCSVSSLFAQTPATLSADSTHQLNEVVVTGYATNRRLLETGASVGLLNRQDLIQRFGQPTLVPALNTIPGVRIDERSPGSYRLAIRGSAIRSPFGVRNVKVYWNELPLTDAGGNTYLNALDVRAIGRVEVIKGPSGSLYGAGTGGTVLFSGLTVPANQSSVEVSALAGAYGLSGNGVTVQTGKDNSAITLSYNHLQADGYREHSQSARDNISLIGSFQVSPKRTISVLGLYTDLFYQTPGGLTEAQYRANPRASRPATRTLPGSAEQGAGIYQKTGYLGVSQSYRWNDRIQNTTVLYGSTVDFANPFITNYEKRADLGLGGRTVTQIRFPDFVLPTVFTVGAEYQQTASIDRNYGNRSGQPDTLQSDDELRARQSVVFAQAEVVLPLGIITTLGLSRNEVRYGFTRYSVVPVRMQARNFTPVWLPRLSALKRLGQNLAAFASISTGYSAPTTQEVRPSDQIFNATLNPERGQNVEVGLRGSSLNNHLQFDMTYYSFKLSQTIVRRSTENGSDYYVNAGRTSQPGFELSVSYDLVTPQAANFWQQARFWHSLTLTNYRFRDYIQGTADLSGNRVTGVAPTIALVGFDAQARPGLYAHLTYQFVDPFPLNDAGTAKSDPARLLNATLGIRRTVAKRWTVDAYLSGDNLLDQTYSLGYDLNAVGNRYYNAAARRNLTGGVRLGVKW